MYSSSGLKSTSLQYFTPTLFHIFHPVPETQVTFSPILSELSAWLNALVFPSPFAPAINFQREHTNPYTCDRVRCVIDVF